MVPRERVKRERRAPWLDSGPGASRRLPPQLLAVSRWPVRMRLGAEPADAAPKGRRQNLLVSAELAAATARVHLNTMCGRYASYLPPEALAALFRRSTRCRTLRRPGTWRRRGTPWRCAGIPKAASAVSIC